MKVLSDYQMGYEMKLTRSTFLALVVLLSPFAANAQQIQITAVGSESGGLIFSDFTIVYEDSSGDSLFQIDELVSFSGFTTSIPGFGVVERAVPDVLLASPDILGISSLSGGSDFWGVILSQSDIGFPVGELVGYGPGFWTYSAEAVGVPVPSELLEELGIAVTGVGPGRSFADKVMLAQTYLSVPDEESACLILGGFLKQVQAQRGKKLTDEQADQLTADAAAVIAAIGCD
jgi:hypothetical protein